MKKRINKKQYVCIRCTSRELHELVLATQIKYQRGFIGLYLPH